MDWKKWIDIVDWETPRIAFQHGFSCTVVIGIFAWVHWYATHILDDGWFKAGVLLADEFALVGTMVWLVREMAVLLWNRRIRIGQLILA